MTGRPEDVLDLGFVAHDLLQVSAEVETFTAFERSAYLAVRGPNGAGLVAIGDGALGRGPFTVRVRGVPGLEFSRALGFERRPKGGRIEERQGIKGLALAGVPFMPLATAPVWRPPTAPIALAIDIRRGCVALKAGLTRALTALGPDDPGLAPLGLDGWGRSTETLRSAAPLVQVVKDGLAAAIVNRSAPENMRQALTFLVGLGPGLTPSGDDLIGGLFLALTALHEGALRDDLWMAIAPELNQLTTEISGMHLAVAADGFGGEAFHDLMCAVFRGQPAEIDGHLDRVAAIGHTSGLDTIAGLVLAIEAWLVAGPDRQAPRASRT